MNLRRSNLMGIASAGCLAIALALTGCSPASSRNDGGTNNNTNPDSGTNTPTDAGGRPDSGPADAGNSNAHGLGSNCPPTGGTTPMQGACSTGLLCESLSQINPELTMCSMTCDPTSTVNTCGSNTVSGGTYANVCGPQQLCYPGCDVTVPGSCGRSDFVCLPASSSGNAGICEEDCNRQGASYCESQLNIYPYFQCEADAGMPGDMNYGACVIVGATSAGVTTCGTGAGACATGQACEPLVGQTPAVSVCIPDCSLGDGGFVGADGGIVTCRANADCETGLCNVATGGSTGTCAACPAGYSCSPADPAPGNACTPIPSALYEPCEVLDFNVQCPGTDDYCISFQSPPATTGPTEALCLTICGPTGVATCPGTETCVQDTFCLQTCTVDGGTACPCGTTCMSNGTTDYCFPTGVGNGCDGGMITVPTDAGPTDAGAADAGQACDTTAAMADGGVCANLIAGLADVTTDIAACQSMDAGLIVPSNFTAGQCCNLINACTGTNDVSNVNQMSSCFAGLAACTSANESSYQGTLSACAAREVELTSSCNSAFLQ